MKRTCASWCGLLLAVTACSTKTNDLGPGNHPATDGGTPPTKMPDPGPVGAFVPLPPQVYGQKVKNLLTGLALDDAELARLTAHPNELPALIDAWMALPQWRERMIDFFKQSFQQTQTDINDYDEQLGRTTNPWNNQDKIKFVRSAEESFARTALELVSTKRPFTEVLTTDRLMLNPPLTSAYASIDAMPQNDMDKPVQQANWLRQKYPNLVFVRTTNLDPLTGMPVPIPLEESINPLSPNFMKWFDPNPYKGMQPRCAEPDMRMGQQAFVAVADFMFGGRPGCGSTRSQFTDADWEAWRMVTIRPPRAGEERTVFWDLPRLRDPKADLVVSTPRIGFLTTLAFFANWPTNISNSYRVTTNQALIVALGRSFDDRNITVQVNETSSDSMHVKPGTACYACHSTLDPMRDFFRQSFSVPYGAQLQPAAVPATATFSVDGAPPVTGTGVGAFAQAMAKHPRFAVAWAQKLCQFANASPCVDDDPELVRVAEAFRASNHDFQVLVREMFSSPLVTFAQNTRTAKETGVAIGITRRETLCAALDNRLELGDFCSIRQATPGQRNVVVNTARNLALSIPGAGYARGDESPLLPHDPSMFFSSASENLCDLLASTLVDGKNGRYQSAQSEQAVKDMVVRVMGLPPSDPRSGEMTTILTDHLNDALRAGVGPTLALRSTFTLACESPLAVSLGL
ncbi:MAG TPA: hypothetical protein VN914_08955 [Polyangia bacterium]|nr:hypothetical protein [Polyangia bacterium]